jgi:NitT/TauT family transport system substrate-binding protein
LVTRDDYVRTVADFRESDRITVGIPKAAIQAILLQMAAAKAFGPENYAKLDHLTIGMPNPEAAAALISGAGVSADFNVPPFSYRN